MAVSTQQSCATTAQQRSNPTLPRSLAAHPSTRLLSFLSRTSLRPETQKWAAWTMHSTLTSTSYVLLTFTSRQVTDDRQERHGLLHQRRDLRPAYRPRSPADHERRADRGRPSSERKRLHASLKRHRRDLLPHHSDQRAWRSAPLPFARGKPCPLPSLY